MATESSALAYDELVDRLVAQNQFVIHYDLEAVQEAARLLGLERPGRRVVLVGGTNGKGTTCASLNAYAQAAGLRVGLYTSPHLLDMRERIRIQSLPVAETEFATALSPIFSRFSRTSEESRALSYFEILTLGAWRLMSQHDLDLAIFEVGLGGRLDATNALDPNVAVITGVALDHRDYLGDTLTQIATEKAGIVREGREVFMHAHSGGAKEVAEAVRVRSGLLREVRAGTRAVEWNRALAWSAFRALYPERATSDVKATGDRRVRWPGRREEIAGERGSVFLDGAHNAQALASTARWVDSMSPAGVDLIFGLSGKRSPLELLPLIAPCARRILAVPCASAPTVPVETVVEAARVLGLNVEAKSSVAEALALSARPCAVVGSLYLVGDALRALGRTIDDLEIYAGSNRSESSR